MIILALTACITSSNFDERYAQEYCRYAQECEVLDLEGFSTLSECESEVVTLPDECEAFDRKKAKQCLEALAALSCEDAIAGAPGSCGKVCP